MKIVEKFEFERNQISDLVDGRQTFTENLMRMTAKDNKLG